MKNCRKKPRKTEIATIFTLAAIIFISLTSVFSSIFLSKKQTTISKAAVNTDICDCPWPGVKKPDGSCEYGLYDVGYNPFFVDKGHNPDYCLQYDGCVEVNYSDADRNPLGGFGVCRFSNGTVCRRNDYQGGCGGMCNWECCAGGGKMKVSGAEYDAQLKARYPNLCQTLNNGESNSLEGGSGEAITNIPTSIITQSQENEARSGLIIVEQNPSPTATYTPTPTPTPTPTLAIPLPTLKNQNNQETDNIPCEGNPSLAYCAKCTEFDVKTNTCISFNYFKPGCNDYIGGDIVSLNNYCHPHTFEINISYSINIKDKASLAINNTICSGGLPQPYFFISFNNKKVTEIMSYPQQFPIIGSFSIFINKNDLNNLSNMFGAGYLEDGRSSSCQFRYGQIIVGELNGTNLDITVNFN